ncbi:MAG: hypothetical protein KDD47_01365 [Acidobacteria bacterium]|nr:hypothetical protein [Acidobacteriota bacterium]
MTYEPQIRRFLLALLAIPALGALPLSAQVPPGPPRLIEITSGSTDLDFTSLPGYGPSVVSVAVDRPVLHGTLVQNASSFTFKPEQDFWEIGGDGFTYTLTYSDSSELSATVELLPGLHDGEQVILDGFEQGQTSILTYVGQVSLNAKMAIFGARGAELTVDAMSPDAYVTAAVPSLGTNQGNRIRFGTVPPDPLEVGSFENLIFSARITGTTQNLIEVWVKDAEGQISIRGRAWDTDLDTWVYTPWRQAHSQSHRVEIDWWPESLNLGLEAGFYLWVDEFLVDGLELAQDFALASLEFFCGPQGHTGGALSFGIDQLEVYQGGVDFASDVELADAFEDPASAAWTAVPAPGGSVGVDAGGAITGLLGVEADLAAAQGQSEYLKDTTPDGAGHYRARFLVDTTGAQILPCDSVLIFSASESDTFTGAAEHVKVLLRRACTGSGYQIKARGRDGTASGSGQWWDSAWWPVTDGVHDLELDWRAASGSAVADGYLRLWVDGGYLANITFLANEDRVIEAVLLGTLGVDAGSIGTLAFDDFESWSESPPGL